ncbi:H-NS histone family protein [Variibacter gotjawalensis]|uniref:H-NS histone family protein n=1 Tax=Variibacter gotjawalensis TaxID=1333996 RepID=A0A0S3PU98_9BRAD|nr:H-NS histone family protein [Variibacter gotjawalensis]NIK49836.1 DNA-binding protein H-NS [Variibacter gotjawalensis]RZS45835.1 DNA-binding protein H-NS [Variibacter gotjawalensis]BAT59511.1 H-NS histone family protein [Variibacter gotjawalensis]
MHAPLYLSRLSEDELLALRSSVQAALEKKRTAYEAALTLIERSLGGSPGRRKRGVKKGTKLSIKFRGPNGEQWTGRGLRPRWLTLLIKKGRKLEDFAVKA